MFLLMENPDALVLALHQFCFYFCGVILTFFGGCDAGESSTVVLQLDYCNSLQSGNIFVRTSL